jgi:hypothetical protein
MTHPGRVPASSVHAVLAEEFARLASDVADLLDIDAGLQEAMIGGHRSRLLSDLQSIIDVDAGLSAAIETAQSLEEPATTATGTGGPTPQPKAERDEHAPTRVSRAALGQLIPMGAALLG